MGEKKDQILTIQISDFLFILPEVQELSVEWMIPMEKTVEKKKRNYR